MQSFAIRLTCIATALAVAACTYPIRNEMASVVGDGHGYQLNMLASDEMPETLVIVTASGGGTRAAALALSVLEGMEAVRLPNNSSLARQVDVISSVSGGSVTAAYFAMKGSDGFETLKKDFLDKNGMRALAIDGLNPFGLARLATPGTERIDVLIDYLNRQLFHGATYQTLLDERRRPLLVLNAADMVEGTPFSFNQRTFDLICSDLPRFPLATAVAASAAFPVALSPVTLKNYRPCPAVPAIGGWPPAWVAEGAEDSWYVNPVSMSLARVENTYALGGDAPAGDRKLFVHLLDGGIADNLGIAAPYRMLTMGKTYPNFLADIGKGKITKLIFVMINARSAAVSELDESPATPGMADMLLASINAPIDRAAMSMASRLRQTLLDEFRQLLLGDPALEARFHALEQNTALISIDFDSIGDAACRRKFHQIKTSWTLEEEEVNALMDVGKALLGRDPAFEDLLRITGAKRPAFPSLQQTCEKFLLSGKSRTSGL